MLNNNFSKLIKLYEKYRKQQRNQMLLKLLALIVVLAAGYLIYMQNSKSPELSVDTTNTNTIQNNTPASTATSSVTDSSTPIQNNTITEPVNTVTAQPAKTEKQLQNTNNQISEKTESKEDLFQLKPTQREGLYKMLVDYKDQKSYKTAIKIAQFYLLQKEYKKAVKWAVEASKKDPSQAQSWIIYAKAKVALGKPEIAKRALAIYLKHNSSQEAQDFLNSL
jgi:tetratricopeptide (TPR) repeat protein